MRKAISPAKAEAAQRFGAILIQLYLLGYTDAAVSELLDLPRSSIWDGLNGRKALPTMKTIIMDAEEKLRHIFESSFPLPIEDAAFGVRTQAGVSHVLEKMTPNKLNEESVRLVAARTARIVKVLRAHLNLLMQVEADDVRSKAVNKLVPELEELVLAMRAFSAFHPIQVLNMNSGTRAILAAGKTKKEQARK